MDIKNEDYILFNNFYFSGNGINSGVGTYSSQRAFVSGSVSCNATFSVGGSLTYSAAFVFDLRRISMAANTNYTPGTNSICYISKSGTSNLDFTIATPSYDGTYLILKRTDTNAGYVAVRTSSGQSNLLPYGQSVINATQSIRLNSTTAPTSIKLVYVEKTWYQI
jgi:hypothetical protein